MDLATLIKPVLIAGDLRMIGSTTFEEFKHIEKDRALARRLQKVAVDEPTVEETVRILKGLQKRYEDHHQVRYTDAALEAAARLAARHLRDLRLPDSAIDLIDEAGAICGSKAGTGRRSMHRVPQGQQVPGASAVPATGARAKVRQVRRLRAESDEGATPTRLSSTSTTSSASSRGWRTFPKARRRRPTSSGCARWTNRSSAWCSARTKP